MTLINLNSIPRLVPVPGKYHSRANDILTFLGLKGIDGIFVSIHDSDIKYPRFEISRSFTTLGRRGRNVHRAEIARVGIVNGCFKKEKFIAAYTRLYNIELGIETALKESAKKDFEKRQQIAEIRAKMRERLPLTIMSSAKNEFNVVDNIDLIAGGDLRIYAPITPANLDKFVEWYISNEWQRMGKTPANSEEEVRKMINLARV